MRILFVISGLGLGGAEKQVILLSREMARRGHSVCIYTLTDLVLRADGIIGDGIELIVDRKRMRLDLQVLWRLRRHLVSWRPDIVHGFLYDGNLYARLATVGTGVPALDSERNDSYDLSTLQSIGYYLTSALSRGIVANTHAGAEFAARTYGGNKKDIQVVWNGIDLSEVNARLSAADKPAHELFPGVGLKRVCVIGSIKPQKDHLLAMRVARRLIDIDNTWRMIVVGDELPHKTTNYKAQVIDSRDSLGLQAHVHFVGGRRDVPEIMASCDALLVTSIHEGFPNVVLEAMACGTPVVSTDYSDVRRILPMDWQVIPSRDEDALALALIRCQHERATVTEAQRRWVQTHAAASISADAMLSVYAASVRRPIVTAERTS